MPGLRAAFKGLLKRSHSTGSSSAEAQPPVQASASAVAVGSPSRSSSRQSSPHIPLKSPSKFSVQDSIREEEADDHFHDAAETSPRPPTLRPASNSNSASTAAAPPTPGARAPDIDQPTVDLDDDDATNQDRHGTSSHSDKPSLTLQCATPEAGKHIDAEYVALLPCCPTSLPKLCALDTDKILPSDSAASVLNLSTPALTLHYPYARSRHHLFRRCRLLRPNVHLRTQSADSPS